MNRSGCSIAEKLKNLHTERKLAVQPSYRSSQYQDAGTLPPAFCVRFKAVRREPSGYDQYKHRSAQENRYRRARALPLLLVFNTENTIALF